MPRKFIDITGQRFGRWTVLRFDQKKGRENYWWCVCDCGTEKSVATSPLNLGKSTSCGCFQREDASRRVATHGYCRKNDRRPEYSIWRGMLTRCENPNEPAYRNYGGRGITVCEQWHDFATFLKDVGNRPSPDYSLDRIDNSKGYEPGNIAWATNKEQANNTRVNRIIEIDGTTKTLAQWCDALGIKRQTVQSRLTRGWNEKDAVMKSPRGTRTHNYQ